MSRYHLRTLGPVAVTTMAGAPTAVPAGKPLALLAYLAVAGRTPREDAARLLWPDAPMDTAKQSLRQAISFLRKTLADDLFLQGTGLAVNSECVSCDVVLLRESLARGDLAEAEIQYRGAFLEAFAFPGLRAWEEWVETTRAEVAKANADALHAAAIDQRTTDAPGAAVLLRRAVDVEPGDPRHWLAAIDLLLDLRSRRQASDMILGARAALSGMDAEGALAKAEERLAALGTVRPGGSSEPLLLEFVGRSADFARIQGLWRVAQAGVAEAVFVTGPTGIGKTRLLEELQRAVTPATCVHVRAAEAEHAIPWSLATDLIRKLRGVRGAAGITLSSERLLRSLAPGPNAAAVGERHDLSSVVSLADALEDLLDALAGEAPLLVLIDDLHWADSESVALLARAVRQSQTSRCLFVLAYRSDDADRGLQRMAESLQASGRATPIRLRPLTGEEVAEMLSLSIAADDQAMVDLLARRIYRTTLGNPLFVAETLRSLHEDQTILRVGEHWELRAGALPESIPLPPSMRAVLDTRFRRLSEEAIGIASCLADAPRDAGMDELRRATGLPQGAFVRGVGELVEREVVGWVDDARLAFSHDQIRVEAQRYRGLGRRRLARWWRLPRRRQVGIIAAGLVVVGAVGVGVGFSMMRANPRYGGGQLYLVSTDSVVVLDPARPGARPRRPSEWTPRRATHPVPTRTAAGRIEWYAVPTPVLGGPYITRVTPNGTRVVVRMGPFDAIYGGLSPDGRWLLYAMDNPLTPQYDLLIVVARSDGSSPRIIYRAASTGQAFSWSPDGRLLILRLRGMPDTLAVLTPLGREVFRATLPGILTATWCGDSKHAAIFVQEQDGARPWMLDLPGRVVRRLPWDAVPPVLACSPDGSALVYTAVREGRPVPVLRPLTGAMRSLTLDKTQSSAIYWVPDRIRPVAQGVRISSIRPRLKIGQRAAAEATVIWTDGAAREDTVSWVSRDPGVLSVTQDGVMTGNAAGRTFVVATAEGWLQDSVAMMVDPVPGEGLVFYDRLATLDTSRWFVLGSPAPKPLPASRGVALSMNGDGNEDDGLVSRATFSLPRGGRLGLQYRMRVTRPDRQRLVLCLVNLWPPRAGHEELPRWDWREGACFAYPADELARFDIAQALMSVDADGLYLRLPGDLPPNDWTRIALRLRADGYVSVQINDRAPVISRIRLFNGPGTRWRVLLTNSAVDTEVLVRDLTLREGPG